MEGNTSLNLKFEVIWCYDFSCMAQQTQVMTYLDLTESCRGGHQASNVTGYISGYWFLGTLLVDHCKLNNPNYLHQESIKFPDLALNALTQNQGG
jgi:hypothetical protein